MIALQLAPPTLFILLFTWQSLFWVLKWPSFKGLPYSPTMMEYSVRRILSPSAGLVKARNESRLARLGGLGKQLWPVYNCHAGLLSSDMHSKQLHVVVCDSCTAGSSTALHAGALAEHSKEPISQIGYGATAVYVACRVGFNAIYHLTDVPSFVSGEHLVIFDPHCKHLPAISAANPGKKINFVTHDLKANLTHQAAPYHLFGCDMQQYFAGTLFRFPLRTQEQAERSTISKQVGLKVPGAVHCSSRHYILLPAESCNSVQRLVGLQDICNPVPLSIDTTDSALHPAGVHRRFHISTLCRP